MREVSGWWQNRSSWPGYVRVLRTFREVTEGLDFLHEQGIIHRDIKPENIFLSRDRTHVKIGDLGITAATRGRDEDRAGLEMAGTPGYIAPEVWEERPYSTRADIWSL